MQSVQQNYIPEIDGLRAIAVMSVLLFHLGFSTFSGGYVGVDIFFVISGYLITKIIADEMTRTNQFNFSNFFMRRARRLLPALIFVLVISFFAAFILFTPQHFEKFGAALVFTSLSLSNFYFWNESGYFNAASEYNPLLHTWSLGVEEQFYLFWPIILLLLLKSNTKALLWIALLLASILSMLLNIALADGHSQVLSKVSPQVAAWFSDGAATIFYLTPFRVFEFSIGAALVWMNQYRPEKNIYSEAIMASSLAMIAYAVFFYTESTTFPSYNALVPCVGAAGVIFSTQAKYSASLLRNNVTVFIGLISYSLYLVHWPMIVFYKYYKISVPTTTEKIAIVFTAIFISYLIYQHIEQRYRHPHQGAKSKMKGKFVLVSASLLLAITLPAASVWANAGWQWRSPALSEEMAAQLKDSKQFHIDQYGGAGFPETGWISGGESGMADIIVMGDSHARQLATGLRESIGGNIFESTVSCLVLPGMTRNTPGKDWDALCRRSLDVAVKMIEKNPNAVVVVAEAWNYQIQVAAHIDTRDPILTNQNTEDAYRVVVTKLDELKKAIGNRKLVIVGNVPGAGGKDVIGCYLRPKFISYDCEEILLTPLRADVGNEIFARFARQNSDVYFLNPFDAFCTNEVCRTQQEGRVFYSDGQHLSKEGSKYFARHFKPLLLSL